MECLNEVLKISKGVTSFVGSGGKTSAMLQSAKELVKKGQRVIVTTTTKMFCLDESEVDCIALEESREKMIEQLEKLEVQQKMVVVGLKECNGKMIGIDGEWLEVIKDYAEYVLVEADGSRRLPIKAPGEFEPVIPTCTHHVISVIGWSGVGQAICKCSFRSEKVSEIVGKNEHEYLAGEDVEKLIVSEEGLKKDLRSSRWTVLINQVDQREEEEKVHGLAVKIKAQQNVNVVMSAIEQKKWINV